jgi:chemotaxis protein methyltransferase CheR
MENDPRGAPLRTPRPAGPGVLLPGRGLPLASGDLTPGQAAELASLTEQIDSATGLSLSSYKQTCFRRRVAVRMRATGVTGYAEYGGVLRADPAEYEKLLAAVTINVSRFFRNRDVWRLLEERVLLDLAARDAPYLNVWSAGCAAGEEPYTLAMVIEAFDRAHPDAGADRFRLVATDVDPDALDAARRAEYADLAMAETTAADRERWFEPDGPPHCPVARIRSRVSFWRLDLLSAHFPRDQSLIVCRNVIMYFDQHSQESILRRAHAALVPGGYLVLGRAESLVGGAAELFEPVSVALRVYRAAA